MKLDMMSNEVQSSHYTEINNLNSIGFPSELICHHRSNATIAFELTSDCIVWT